MAFHEQEARDLAGLMGAELSVREFPSGDVEITIRAPDGLRFADACTGYIVGSWEGARAILRREWGRLSYMLAERFSEGQRLRFWTFSERVPGMMWRDVIFTGRRDPGDSALFVRETHDPPGRGWWVHASKLAPL